MSCCIDWNKDIVCGRVTWTVFLHIFEMSNIDDSWNQVIKFGTRFYFFLLLFLRFENSFEFFWNHFYWIFYIFPTNSKNLNLIIWLWYSWVLNVPIEHSKSDDSNNPVTFMLSMNVYVCKLHTTVRRISVFIDSKIFFLTQSILEHRIVVQKYIVCLVLSNYMKDVWYRQKC